MVRQVTAKLLAQIFSEVTQALHSKEEEVNLPGFSAESAVPKPEDRRTRMSATHYATSAMSRSAIISGVVPALRTVTCDCGGYCGADGDWHIACYCF
jgi:hypothetical protein